MHHLPKHLDAAPGTEQVLENRELVPPFSPAAPTVDLMRTAILELIHPCIPGARGVLGTWLVPKK